MVSVISDLVKRDQLVGEGVGLLLALLEVERVVEVRPRGQGAVVREPVQVRGHGVDGGERRIGGGGHGRAVDAVILTFMLGEQRSLLLKLLLVVIFGLALLMVASIIRHVRGRVRAHFRPVRVLGERRCCRRSGCQRAVQAAQSKSRNRRPFVSPFRVLVHVLTQIRLLRITLATVLADVRLQMLRLFVFWDVFQQILLVREAFVAGVAFEGLVGLVAAAVALEVGELGEGFRAADLGAPVGFVSCVGADVLLQVRELGELALADLAAVGLDAEVDAGVLGQVRGVGEGLGALGAAVGLRLPKVDLRVQLQVCF